MLSKKCETLIGNNIIYVLVNLNNLGQPEYHIVPSNIIANTVKEGHQKWLNTPGKNGQEHNDSNVRLFTDFDNKYLNNWNLLE